MTRVILILLRLYSRLSLPVAQSLGDLLGRLAWRLHVPERDVALANLQHCLPALSAAEHEVLARQALRESAKLLAEVPLAWLKPTSAWQGKIALHGFDQRLVELREAGRGVILVAPHLGNWEIGLNAITASIKTTVLYRPPRARWSEAMMVAGRQATGAQAAPTDAAGIKLLLQALKRGEAVAILPDQTPKPSSGAAAVFAPFFGQPAYTMTLVSKLAAKTGAAVLTVYAERLPQGHGFSMHYADLSESIYDADVLSSVTALNQAVEACARACLTQYQWGYKRFKVLPEGMARLY